MGWIRADSAFSGRDEIEDDLASFRKKRDKDEAFWGKFCLFSFLAMYGAMLLGMLIGALVRLWG